MTSGADFRQVHRARGRVRLSAGLLAGALLTWFGGALAEDVPEPPTLAFAFEARVEVADPTVVAELPGGQTRRIIRILGGTVEGPGVKGEILPGGADWQLIRRADGFTDIDARDTIRLDSGHLVYVSNIGIRHAAPEVMARLNAGQVVDQSLIYFRAIPRLETDAPGMEWMMKHLFVSTGERYPNGVVIRFWRVW